jgi:hypothetical protein
MEGAANIVENAKGMTAPDLKVTWNYEGDDGDEGDTPAPAPTPKTGTGSVLPYDGSNYLALKGEGGASFTVNATSVKVDGKDVSSKAQLIVGYVAVKASDLIAAGVTITPGTALSVEYVVDGTSYTASVTP